VDEKKVYPLLDDLLASKLASAFWFCGVVGGTLVMLAVMSLLRKKPTVSSLDLSSLLCQP